MKARDQTSWQTQSIVYDDLILREACKTSETRLSLIVNAVNKRPFWVSICLLDYPQELRFAKKIGLSLYTTFLVFRTKLTFEVNILSHIIGALIFALLPFHYFRFDGQSSGAVDLVLFITYSAGVGICFLLSIRFVPFHELFQRC